MGKHSFGHHRILALVRAAHRLIARPPRPAVPTWASDDTQPITIATPIVRNGEWSMDPRAVEEPPPWGEWLQNLPPVDGWTSTASWLAQHGMGGATK